MAISTLEYTGTQKMEEHMLFFSKKMFLKLELSKIKHNLERLTVTQTKLLKIRR